jgi:phage I-like protein
MSALLRLEGTALATVKNAGGPKWNKLFPANTTRYRSDFPGGQIDFTPDFLTAMIANWQRVGSPGLPVDYAHDEKGVASGWIEGLELREDGLYAAIRWTDPARAAIQADELRYLSPTFATDGDDSATGLSQGPTLYGAALLNTPFLQDLPRVAATARPSHAFTNTTKGNSMDLTQLAKAICTHLGLPDGTDNETMLTSLAKAFAPAPAVAAPAPAGPAAVKTGNPNVGDVPARQGPVDTTPTPPVPPTSDGGGEKGDNNQFAMGAERQALRLELANKDAQIKQLSARIGAIETEKFASDVQRLSERLIREGRIISAQASSVELMARKAGVAEAEKFFGSMPVVVKLGSVGVDAEPTEEQGVEAKTKAYWAAVDAERTKHSIPLTEATRRVNKAQPDLAAAITLTNKKASAKSVA